MKGLGLVALVALSIAVGMEATRATPTNTSSTVATNWRLKRGGGGSRSELVGTERDRNDGFRRRRRLDSSPYDVTLVSQTSAERLWMIEMICERWPGPIAVAVHTPDEEAQSAYRKTLAQVQQGGRCGRATFRNWDQGTETSYPVNGLRNLAMAAVSTSHFMVIDIDFWPSFQLYSAILSAGRRAALEKPKHAIVVPAFKRMGWVERLAHSMPRLPLLRHLNAAPRSRMTPSFPPPLQRVSLC